MVTYVFIAGFCVGAIVGMVVSLIVYSIWETHDL